MKTIWNKKPKTKQKNHFRDVTKKLKNPNKAAKWNKKPKAKRKNSVKRYIDTEYLIYVSTLPCCISGSYDTDPPHHTKTKADKTRHDNYVVPLSRRLHYMYHHQSRTAFYQEAAKVGVYDDDDLRAYALELYETYKEGK
jgi:hypothetical protein